MGRSASQIVVHEFLTGCFRELEAPLATSFAPTGDRYVPQDLLKADAEMLSYMLEENRIVWQARCGQHGAVAMMFSTAEAGRLAGLASGKEFDAEGALSAADMHALQDLAERGLGGGMARLLKISGLKPEPLENVSASDGPTADALLSVVGSGAVIAPFSFSSPPGVEGSGVLVFSEEIESMVPSEEDIPRNAGANDLAANAHLTEAEMSDILSGFSPDAADEIPFAEEEEEEEPRVPSRRPSETDNLDMVLDIRLVATARLGRMEMPIGEILALGPGSIIEVGHMVDEPIELLVNDKLIARGDVVVIDEKFGLRITEIVSPKERIESLR